MPALTIQDLRDQQLILLECISGSKAYGLDVPSSDTDIRGVFVLPKEQLYGLDYIPQIGDSTNDTVFYELGRFIELLLKNNPNILELLATPDEHTIVRHPIMDRIRPELFLSKKCKDTFGGYAFAQIKKARGLNKKISNPMKREKKSILSFCYILHQQGSIPLLKWLDSKGWSQQACGLVNIPHAKDMYALFYDDSGRQAYKGIQKKADATTVLLSSIPKGEPVAAYLYCNSDGYSTYCKEHREYWDWVAKRNEDRYDNNIKHGKNYDSKNMMHTFRLLDMAEEILRQRKVIVHRPNREALLAIRRGEWEYDDLIREAERKMEAVEKAHAESLLPPRVDRQSVMQLLVDMRNELYG
ncbi:MAG: nucleotidyltransferase domain-containing protein [Bacteroidota bacterium]